MIVRENEPSVAEMCEMENYPVKEGQMNYSFESTKSAIQICGF